jgi:hypothetical protein
VLPSGIVLLATFARILHDFCERDETKCHVLYGAQDKYGSHTWNGWAKEKLQVSCLSARLAKRDGRIH